MYLPRDLFEHLYKQFLRAHNALSPTVLVLSALEPDALCACRILTTLLKRDYVSHKIQPISGYGDLVRAGEELVRPMRTSDGGNGGLVICLGVGGLVDLPEILGLNSEDEDQMGGVEMWIIDARRPWNLENVFGGQPTRQILGDVDANSRSRSRGVENGKVTRSYKSGRGGVIVFDDGDIDEELEAERDAYLALEQMPEVDDVGEESDESDDDRNENDGSTNGDKSGSKKRKSWSDREDEDTQDEGERPRQRRRSNSNSSIPSSSPQSPRQPPSPKEPSARTLRRRLLRLRRGHENTLRSYYSLGTSYSEPISSLMYGLASDLGREDNDLLWLAIVGVSSLELSGRSPTGVGLSNGTSESGGSAGWGGVRGERIRGILRDEVRRLNLPDSTDGRNSSDFIPTTARSPTDTSIRLSPEPRFLLLRHWSLYDSMLHSPFLASRLHLWTDNGRKKLHKLLAKMGISLAQCQQNYPHIDISLKRTLHSNLLRYAPHYGLDGIVPPSSTSSSTSPADLEGWGFVRSWGWKACLSATDVGIIIGAILEVGTHAHPLSQKREPSSDASSLISRFYTAYDALSPPSATGSSTSHAILINSLPLATHLARAILRTGTALLRKSQIKHLRAFRMGVVKDGPDVQLFSNPGALVKLALWVGEAFRNQEGKSHDTKGTPLVLATLVEERDSYVVVGLGGGIVATAPTATTSSTIKSKAKNPKEKTAAQTAKAQRREARALRRADRASRRKQAEDNGEEPESEASSSESDSESDTESDSSSATAVEQEELPIKRGLGRNKFGIAFESVADEMGARIRNDSFEHCVVEVRREDLGGFLEGLSGRSVVG